MVARQDDHPWSVHAWKGLVRAMQGVAEVRQKLCIMLPLDLADVLHALVGA